MIFPLGNPQADCGDCKGTGKVLIVRKKVKDIVTGLNPKVSSEWKTDSFHMVSITKKHVKKSNIHQ